MVVTHLARNADGLRGMIEGAAQGRVAAMYPAGMAGREADIEAGRHGPAADLLEDLRLAAARLREACGTLEPAQWEREGEAPAGLVPLWRMLPIRRREVEVHHLDLDVGYGPGDWPIDFVLVELAGAVAGLARRLPDGIGLRLVASDGLGSWDVGGRPDYVIEADGARLLAWLLDRAPAPEGQSSPPLGSWS